MENDIWIVRKPLEWEIEEEDSFPQLARRPLEWEPEDSEAYFPQLQREPLIPADDELTDACWGSTDQDDENVVQDFIPLRTYSLEEDAEKTLNNAAVLFGGGQVSAPVRLETLQKGIAKDTRKRNRSEIIRALAGTGRFRSIDGILYHFSGACWMRCLEKKANEILWPEVMALIGEDADCLSTADMRELHRLLHRTLRREHMIDIRTDNQRYICCRDGVYRIRDGRKLPPDPGLNLFYYLNLSVKDIGNIDGYYAERFLDNATGGDEQLRARILEMIGVILTSEPVKCFFYLEGPSNTGKSQLIQLFHDLFGGDAYYALPSVNALKEQWTTGGLLNKLICCCTDMPDEALDRRTVSNLKQLTGDDQIRGELKGVDPFDFYCTAKFVFASNYPLRVSNADKEDALFKRLVYIPFQNPVPQSEQIPNLHKKLKQEAGYIVELAMEQLKKFRERDRRFTPLPEEMAHSVLRMPSEVECVSEFISECCEYVDGERLPIAELLEAFQTYNGYSTFEGMNVDKFGSLLQKIPNAPERGRSSKLRYVKNLKLKDLRDAEQSP